MKGKAAMNKTRMLVLFLVMILGCTGCQNKEDKSSGSFQEGGVGMDCAEIEAMG